MFGAMPRADGSVKINNKFRESSIKMFRLEQR